MEEIEELNQRAMPTKNNQSNDLVLENKKLCFQGDSSTLGYSSSLVIIDGRTDIVESVRLTIGIQSAPKNHRVNDCMLFS